MTKELKETIEYLDKRSKDLSNYSNKLQNSLYNIILRFGDREGCWECGSEGFDSRHFKYEAYYYSTIYFNSIEEAEKEYKCKLKEKSSSETEHKDKDGNVLYTENTDYHKFVPRIQLDIGIFFDDVTISSNAYSYCTLGLVNNKISYIEHSGINDDDSSYYTKAITKQPRYIQKKIVREKILLNFIQKLKDRVDKETEDTKECSEIVGKMADAIEVQ